VSAAFGTADPVTTEPSWTTALSEADTAGRRLQQAASSLERASRELQSLRQWSETTARLDVAYALTDGPDGGALNAVLTLASAAEGELPSAARMLLEVLTSALGLEPVGERGELLRLGPDELAEFELRGSRPVGAPGERALYRVARPGWCLDVFIVARPVVEPAAD
jgi:hypothetical protein